MNNELTAETFMAAYRQLKERARKKYMCGIIWQEEFTEFSFLDGTRGYGVPNAEKDVVLLLDEPPALDFRYGWRNS